MEIYVVTQFKTTLGKIVNNTSIVNFPYFGFERRSLVEFKIS